AITPPASVTSTWGTARSANGVNGAPANPARHAPVSTFGRPAGPVRDPTSVIASSALSGSGGSYGASQLLKRTTSDPPGRSTRASSRAARSESNQWNASATNAASTAASSSGSSSADPSRQSAPGTRPSPSARIAGAGSTATTCAKRSTTSRVS